MIVSAIKPDPIAAFSLSIQQQGKVFSSQDLLVIGKLALLSKVYESILKAWDTFNEGQSEVRAEKEKGDRSHRRRQEEVGETLQHASRPQRAKMLFHVGDYTSDHQRSLNLPV